VIDNDLKMSKKEDILHVGSELINDLLHDEDDMSDLLDVTCSKHVRSRKRKKKKSASVLRFSLKNKRQVEGCGDEMVSP
jgi:hypothetical protein